MSQGNRTPYVPSRRVRTTMIVAAGGVVVLAVAGLLGWLTGDRFWAGAVGSYVAMVPVTALCLISLAVALMVRLTAPAALWPVGLLVAGVFAAALLEFPDLYLGVPVALDRIFAMPQEMVQGAQVGRMSPIVAACLIVLGSALLLSFSRGAAARSTAQWLALSVFTLGFVLCVAYAYDSPLLNATAPLPPALPSAVGLMVLGGLIAALVADRWPLSIFVGDSVNATLVRAVFPAVCAMAFAFGVVDATRQRLGVEENPVFVSIVIIGAVAVALVTVLGLTSSIGHRLEAAQQSLLDSERRFRQVFEQSNIGMSMTHSDGHMSVNRALSEMLGYSRDELAALTWAEITVPEDIERTQRALDSLTSGEASAVRFAKRYVRKDRSVMWADVSSTLIRDDEGQPLDFATGVVDVTARAHAEQELERVNADLEGRVSVRTAELEDALRAKDDFLRDMSHELRTPLNSIIGFSGMLADGLVGTLQPEQDKQVRMIHSSGEHLLMLINDLLDLSGIERGRVQLLPATFSVADLAAEVAGAIEPLAVGKGLAVTVTVGDDVGVITSDRGRIEQILLNLLGNAVKFTDQGSVGLDISRRGREVELRVRDTGRGIAADELAHVFEEFYQVEDPRVAKTEGTGLGLAVSRRLASMLGGTIAATSEIGKGTTFTLRLPDTLGGFVGTGTS